MTPLNWNSRQLTRGWQRGVTAFYHGLGMTEEDFDRPQVGIGVPLLEGNLCNVHAYELGRLVADGCRAAGLLGFVFGTPGVSDNITQGMEGGNASLVSRNLIANSAECVVTAHCYDAMVGLHHCDKNGPGFAMALARMNYPGLVLSGGSIQPGCYKGRDVTILDVYDSQAAATAGAIPQEEADEISPRGLSRSRGLRDCGVVQHVGIGAGGDGPFAIAEQFHSRRRFGQARGMSRRGTPRAGLLELQIRPRDILTRRAFENAATVIAAAGGSTNGVLHLLAVAREAEVAFNLRDMQAIFRRTPVMCNFAPRGTKTMVDLHKLGGTSVLLKHLLRAGLLDGSCVTVTGRTLAENVADAGDVPAGQELIAPTEAPFKPFADMQVCFGNLAPDGMVFKVSSLSDPRFRGPAICFETGRDVAEAAAQRRIQPGQVIVLRNVGPVASGMPEVVIAASALSVPELNGKVALISDTRISGISHGAIGVHCAPEAAVGGPIAFVRDGDEIGFDLLKGEITLHVSDEELSRRRSGWRPPTIRHSRGYLADFAATVAQANHGCVSKSLHAEC